MSLLTDSPAWEALTRHQQAIAGVHMRELFARDPQRFERFSLRLRDILFDYSKNRITEETMSLLLDLARQANLATHIEAMFSGEKINITENRAVLHVALRNRANRPIRVDGQDVMPEVNRVSVPMPPVRAAMATAATARTAITTRVTGRRTAKVTASGSPSSP